MKPSACRHPKMLQLANFIASAAPGLPPMYAIDVARARMDDLWNWFWDRFYDGAFRDGRLTELGDVGVALAAGWQFDPTGFVAALVTSRFLDRHPDGTLAIHDHAEHMPAWVKQGLRDEARGKKSLPGISPGNPRDAPGETCGEIPGKSRVSSSSSSGDAERQRGAPLPPKPPSPTEPAEASEPVGAGSVASDPGSGGGTRPRPRNRHLPSGLADPRADVLAALKVERRKVTPLLSDDDEWQILQVVDQATRLGVSVLTQLTESLRAFHASRDPWLVERSHPLPSWRRDWNKYLPAPEPAPEAQCPECGDPARDGRCLVVGCPCACRKVAAS